MTCHVQQTAAEDDLNAELCCCPPATPAMAGSRDAPRAIDCSETLPPSGKQARVEPRCQAGNRAAVNMLQAVSSL